MHTALSFDSDYGQIRIIPNVSDKVNRMKLRQAEERADNNLQIAVEATQENSRLRIELLRLTRANQELLVRMHKMSAGCLLLMLPATEVVL